MEGFSELKSLLTISIASSLNVLGELIITKGGELEHIITDEGHAHNNMNDCFLFSNLKEVIIFDAEKLKYLFGNCHSNQKDNVHIDLNIPNLKILSLHNVPNMVGICTKNYSVKALSLQDISLKSCPQLLINTVMDLFVDVSKREDLSKRKNTKTSTNEIVGEQFSTFDTIATPSSKPDEETKGGQEALGEGISLNKGPQRVKEPTNDLFPKETTLQSLLQRGFK